MRRPLCQRAQRSRGGQSWRWVWKGEKKVWEGGAPYRLMEFWVGPWLVSLSSMTRWRLSRRWDWPPGPLCTRLGTCSGKRVDPRGLRLDETWTWLFWWLSGVVFVGKEIGAQWDVENGGVGVKFVFRFPNHFPHFYTNCELKMNGFWWSCYTPIFFKYKKKETYWYGLNAINLYQRSKRKWIIILLTWPTQISPHPTIQNYINWK